MPVAWKNENHEFSSYYSKYWDNFAIFLRFSIPFLCESGWESTSTILTFILHWSEQIEQNFNSTKGQHIQWAFNSLPRDDSWNLWRHTKRKNTKLFCRNTKLFCVPISISILTTQSFTFTRSAVGEMCRTSITITRKNLSK